MKRPSLPTLLLLSIYLFYSLCPLLYPVDGAQAEELLVNCQLTAAAHRQTWNYRTLSSLRSDADSSSSQVLLIKKRAIVSFKGLADKLLPRLFKNSDDVRSTVAPSAPREITTCPGGFQFYHSGISPPSA